nr:MAG TPA: PROTEIN/RNA Complex translation initiation, 48S, small [Caudoviricetes sp.]
MAWTGGADYLMDDMATWEDYRRSIKEELNLDLRFRIND